MQGGRKNFCYIIGGEGKGLPLHPLLREDEGQNIAIKCFT